MDSHTREHLHESPKIMTLPLAVLAILSVIGGYVGIPHILGGGNRFENFLEPVTGGMQQPQQGEHVLASSGYSSFTELILMIGSIIFVLIFIYLAYHFYLKNIASAGRMRERFSGIYKLIYGKYFVDELYGALIVRPVVNGSLFLWKIFDVLIIDGLINGGATLVGDVSKGLRPVQSGIVRTYATIFLVGAVIIIGIILIFR